MVLFKICPRHPHPCFLKNFWRNSEKMLNKFWKKVLKKNVEEKCWNFGKNEQKMKKIWRNFGEILEKFDQNYKKSTKKYHGNFRNFKIHPPTLGYFWSYFPSKKYLPPETVVILKGWVQCRLRDGIQILWEIVLLFDYHEFWYCNTSARERAGVDRRSMLIDRVEGQKSSNFNFNLPDWFPHKNTNIVFTTLVGLWRLKTFLWTVWS